jgi:hypothetical protein
MNVSSKTLGQDICYHISRGTILKIHGVIGTLLADKVMLYVYVFSARMINGILNKGNRALRVALD